MRTFPAHLSFPNALQNSCCSENEDKHPICIHGMKENAISGVGQKRSGVLSTRQKYYEDSYLKIPGHVYLKKMALTEPTGLRLLHTMPEATAGAV